MKKHVFGKQLSRDANERKALFKGLMNALVMQESIQTTTPKAKAIRAQIEKLITKAKRKGSASRSLLQPWLQPDALEKVLNDLSVRFAQRSGGYTRIITIGERFGDNATMAVIEFVEKKTEEPKGTRETKEPKEKLEATISKQPKQSQKPQSSKKEKPTTKKQRPPSKAEMEGRKVTKGSPAKESKKKAK